MGFGVREKSRLTVLVIKLVLQGREAVGNVVIRDDNFKFQVSAS